MHLFILDPQHPEEPYEYEDTRIPAERPPARASSRGAEIVIGNEEKSVQDRPVPKRNRGQLSIFEDSPEDRLFLKRLREQNSALGDLPEDRSVPERIRAMTFLYDYGDATFRNTCRNFCIQAKYMESYEDDYPWRGELRRFFTTYHDLTWEQLRGYFSWRTRIRKGIYEPISTSVAYIYLYELLNGIGAATPEESLRKMKEFEEGYILSGVGDRKMQKNLRRWMFELAVVRGLSPETARIYQDEEQAGHDHALEILRRPEERSDEEIFEALCTFAQPKFRNSAAVKKNETEAKRLFAAVWKYAAANYKNGTKDLFTLCFGKLREFNWHPLENAVYWNPDPLRSADYQLGECRRYLCKNGLWKERCYHSLYFNRYLFEGLLHEADRCIRLYLKAGHPLKPKPEEAWAAALTEKVIELDKAAKAEAAKPRVVIHFEDLDRIRRDAGKTRDRLLTEEETMGDTMGTVPIVSDTLGTVPIVSPPEEILTVPLDAGQVQVLIMLLRGESVTEFLRDRGEMPEVFADALNEALFDEIGDTAVECDGEGIVLVEDYREDISRILGESAG